MLLLFHFKNAYAEELHYYLAHVQTFPVVFPVSWTSRRAPTYLSVKSWQLSDNWWVKGQGQTLYQDSAPFHVTLLIKLVVTKKNMSVWEHYCTRLISHPPPGVKNKSWKLLFQFFNYLKTFRTTRRELATQILCAN